MKVEYQLMNDYTDSSMIIIDGIEFVVAGWDDQDGYTLEDLENGLQKRIHDTILKIVTALQTNILITPETFNIDPLPKEVLACQEKIELVVDEYRNQLYKLMQHVFNGGINDN